MIMKMKESEKRDKYLNLAKELKRIWNVNVMVVPIVMWALGTIPKGLVRRLEELEIGGRAKTIQTTALLRSAGILRSVLETWCHSNSNGRLSANVDVKNSQGVKIMIIGDINRSLNHCHKTRPRNNKKKKKENLPSCWLCRPRGPQIENKESENRIKYLDFVRKVRKLSNMKVTGIPIQDNKILPGDKRGSEFDCLFIIVMSMCFNQDSAISSLYDKPLKSVV